MVHTVQTRKKTVSYGADQDAGNTYYEWPSWIPILGVQFTTMPVSNFDLDLFSYEAYDQGRLPFVVDVKAFFRIEDTNKAASRVASFGELKEQLLGIVQGAVRSIMANAELESIMSERSIYGTKFTEEVAEQLESWGVVPVKNIELMDIRDTGDSKVIQNIMAKKKSEIQMDSRVTVAENMRKASEAEIEAQRRVDIKNEEAKQAVGTRQAEVTQKIGTAEEKAQQAIKEEQKTTKEKEMEVLRVQEVKAQEIAKEQGIIEASEKKETEQLAADAYLYQQEKEADGIKRVGDANADAEKAMQLARVTAETTLAEKIGENKGYQNYLVNIREVEANEKVGIEKAQALKSADLKVIANSGDVSSGVNNLMDLFSPKGGTAVGGAMEAMANTETGKKFLEKVGIDTDQK
jgi:flotillin